jgi:hypothetical protein
MACGALALLAPALARADEQLVPTGSLAYTWQAQPQLGCAKENLCGVHGAVIVDIQYASFVRGAPAGFPGPLQLAVSVTARSVGPGSGTSCADILDVPEIDLNVKGPLFVGREGPFNAISSGRCAGPTSADLNRLPFRVRRTGGRSPSFNLSGTGTSTAGPYTIRLDSTLKLRPGDNGVESSSSGGGGSGPIEPKTLAEEVLLRYRLVRSAGTEVASFMATSDPLCVTLGVCGASGSMTVSGVTARDALTVVALRAVNHRVGKARVLADLRAGKLTGFGFASARTGVAESIDGGPAGHCSDTRSAPVDLALYGDRRSTEVDLYDNYGDALRTYCPGPLDEDLMSGSGPLLQARIAASRLGARRITITASPSGRFADSAYSAQWSGSLTLTLARVGLRVRMLGGSS